MTYHTIPLIEKSNQFFSLICQYCATRRFCEAAQNCLVRSRTQSTSIYLYYFFCSIRLNESSREMREIARGDAIYTDTADSKIFRQFRRSSNINLERCSLYSRERTCKHTLFTLLCDCDNE